MCVVGYNELVRGDKEMWTQKTYLFFKIISLITLFAPIVYADTPVVNVLAPDVFVRDKGEPFIEEIALEVPLAGSAILDIKNGAENDDSTGEKVSSSIIMLNGICVVGPNNFNQNIDAVQVPVELQAGENVLGVELRGKPGGCISIKISAPVDSIDLVPITEPIELGVDPLICQATVTGLGVPAEGVDVLFEVSGFGSIPPLADQTDSTGTANVTFDPFTTIGTGVVTATVVGSDPVLSDNESFEVKKFQEITLDQGLTIMNVEVGSSQYIAYTVSLAGAGGQTFNVSFDQNISPDNGGISLSSDYPGGWSASIDTTWLVNEFITGVTPGTYTATSTATIVETGDVVTSELIVNVFVLGAEIPAFGSPGAEPDGIEPNNPTDVTFSVLVTGVSLPLAMRLENIDEEDNVNLMGNLSDDGLNGDLLAGDNVYSGTFTIEANSLGKLYYRAATSLGGYDYVSEEGALTITGLPVGPGLSDPCSLVEDPCTGELLYSDEIIVAFFDLISEDRIQEIVAAEGGTIVGTIPALNLYQISIPGDGTIAGVQAAIEAFEAYVEVVSASPNHDMQPDAFPQPDSTLQQDVFEDIRLDEAWLVSKHASNIIVAVLDTGVDSAHQDLSVIGNSTDNVGHGTIVAGIIAAQYNGVGISGVSQARILPVKALGSAFRMAWALLHAVKNQAKVINISLGSENWLGDAHLHIILPAVWYAQSKDCLIIAAAGNQGVSTKRYPAAFSEVMAVGGTNIGTDTRWSFSQFGDWIEIAAPSNGVYSIEPGSTTPTPHWGTSFAAPQVAGAAARVWSMHSDWTPTQVRERLKATARPLPSTEQLGAGCLDVFEAVFNGSFEIGDLSEWSKTGTCSSLESLGALVPQHRKRMGYASTGPAGDQVAATLEKTFTFQSGVSSIPIKFEYNFVTEEYPEWVGTIYDDALTITLIAPNGTQTVLATETINTSSFTMYTASPAIDFPGGDSTVGQTGWKTVSATIPVTQGSGQYKINITDAGDDIYDSVVLIDNIRLK